MRRLLAFGAAATLATGLAIAGAGTASAAPSPVTCATNVTAAVLHSLQVNHVPTTPGQVIPYFQIVVVNGVGAIQPCVVIVPALP